MAGTLPGPGQVDCKSKQAITPKIMSGGFVSASGRLTEFHPLNIWTKNILARYWSEKCQKTIQKLTKAAINAK